MYNRLHSGLVGLTGIHIPHADGEMWSSPVMSTMSAFVCIFEQVYDRISYTCHILLQCPKCVNHVILGDVGQSGSIRNFRADSAST
ncbi:hypothetical protein Hamer_G023365 [Homarus americanus]|uniref:Uncharacterized protein n=1 Tax=Homarus americanus TaxID=6706 RepID=A0A8J5JT91_HOMAM|nr:hypothetical protein Hamer_G023365 [Homarus americanus]